MLRCDPRRGHALSCSIAPRPAVLGGDSRCLPAMAYVSAPRSGPHQALLGDWDGTISSRSRTTRASATRSVRHVMPACAATQRGTLAREEPPVKAPLLAAEADETHIQPRGEDMPTGTENPTDTPILRSPAKSRASGGLRSDAALLSTMHTERPPLNRLPGPGEVMPGLWWTAGLRTRHLLAQASTLLLLPGLPSPADTVIVCSTTLPRHTRCRAARPLETRTGPWCPHRPQQPPADLPEARAAAVPRDQPLEDPRRLFHALRILARAERTPKCSTLTRVSWTDGANRRTA